MVLNSVPSWGSQSSELNETSRAPSQDNEIVELLAHALYKAQAGQLEGALQLFQKTVSLAPTNVPVLMHYAAFLGRQQDWRGAKQMILQADAQDAAAVSTWLSHEQGGSSHELGYIYLRALHSAHLGHYADAELDFERLIRDCSGEATILIDQAAMFEAAGNWDLAELSYKAALATNGMSADELIAYGMLLSKRGRDKEALATMKQAQLLGSADGRLKEEIERLEKRANRDERAYELALVAQYKLHKQDEEGAADRVAEALELSPECALAHRVHAALLERKGFLAEAEAHMERAVKSEPANADYQVALEEFRARIASRRQRVQELVLQAQATSDRSVARTLYDEALTLMPDNADVHVAYARWFLPDQAMEAERHLRDALSVAPQHFEANWTAARLLTQQGQMQEAELRFLAALRVQSLNQDLIGEYIDCLVEQERYSDATAQLIVVSDRGPLSARLQIQQAVLWARLGKLDDAESKFRELLESLPDNSALRREYAVLLGKKAEPILAEEQFREALALDANDAFTHREYALFLQTRQRLAEAQKHLELAHSLCPGDEKIGIEVQQISQALEQFQGTERQLALALYRRRESEADDRVEQAFKSAYDRDPESIAVLKEYARFLKDKRDLARAKEMVTHALNIVPKEPQLEALLVAIQEEWNAEQPPVLATEVQEPPPLLTTPKVPEPLPPRPPAPRPWWKRLLGLK